MAKAKRVTPDRALEQAAAPAPAEIEVPPAPEAPPLEAPPTSAGEIAAPAAPGTGALVPTDTAKLALEIAFGIVAAMTGAPEIWKTTDDELDPLAPAVARQLSRIPLVKAIGPDNSELVIVVAGVGTMTLRRLNEYARKVQDERAARPARTRSDIASAGAPARAGSPLAAADAATPPAPANGETAFATEGGPPRLHVGASFGGATQGGAGPRRM